MQQKLRQTLLDLGRRFASTWSVMINPFPAAEDRLPKSLRFAESDFVVRASGVHEVGYGHKWDWEAQPVVAGGAEAGDRGGIVCAGLVGLDEARRIADDFARLPSLLNDE